jgi:ABC-type transport system involved in Fe-S cluster assembly fused permease/ATPase subunit
VYTRHFFSGLFMNFFTALYRIVELTSGSIHVDGVDISKVGLNDIRNGLAIIPQDPVRHHHLVIYCIDNQDFLTATL